MRDLGRIFVWYPFRWTILSLPLSIVVKIGRIMGKVEFFYSRKRTAIMAQNIQRALRTNEKKAYNIVRRNFELHYIHLLEYFKFPYFSKKNIDDYIQYKGLEHLNACLKYGKGIILVHPHLGTMQMPLVALGHKGYRMNQIGQREPDNRNLSWIHRKVALRLRLKIETAMPANFINIGIAKFLRPAYSCLKQNEILMIPGDGRGGTNPVGKKYVLIEFLGQSTYFPRGPVFLARKTGAIMLPLFCYHIENDRQCIEIHAPLKLTYSHDIQQDIQKNTQHYADALSKGVCDHPEHWMFWQEFAPGQMIYREEKSEKNSENNFQQLA